MSLRVGMDLVDVRDVEESLAQFGDRYLQRVFTTREVAACADGADARRLAACFAAKEATLKSIAADGDAVDWRSIELLLGPASDPAVELSGASADLAARTGIVRLSVSVGTTRSYAAAVVLAEGTTTVGEAQGGTWTTASDR
jgi:holo-[acyl-carrier protein] synthase